MRTKRKLLVKILCGLACLSAAFACVLLPKAGNDVVNAETTNWVETRRSAGKVQTYANSKGLDYDEATDSAYHTHYMGSHNASKSSANPWQNIVQMKLTMYSLNSDGLFIDGYAGSLADQWSVPLFRIQTKHTDTGKPAVQVAMQWDCGYDAKNDVTSEGARVDIASGKTLDMGKTYDLEIAFDNVYDETETTKVIGYNYYFKMWSGEDVLWNFTRTTKTKANKDLAADTNATAYMTFGRMFTCEYSLLPNPDEKIELESEKDISYYWAADPWYADDYNPDNIPVEYTDTTKALIFGSNHGSFQQYYPIADENNAMTFRFKATKIPTTGKFIFANNNDSTYNQWTACVQLDYTNDKIGAFFGCWGTAKEVAFTLDVDKEYDIRQTIYYQRKSDASIDGYALIHLAITDVATGTSASVYQSSAGYAYEAKRCNQMHVFYNRSNSGSGAWTKTDSSVGFVISAANPIWNATVVDGASTKTRTDKLTLPAANGVAGKTFIGYVTDDGKIYNAGTEVALTKTTTFTATYVDFHTVEAAAVRVTKGANGDETGLRFKGNVNVSEWTALTQIDADIELCMIIEREDGKQLKQTVTADDCYDVAGQTNKEFAVVISLPDDDDTYYSTVYAAKAAIAITYEGDSQVTYVTTSETSVNSVQNIASVILNNAETYQEFLNKLTAEQRALLEAYALGTDQE